MVSNIFGMFVVLIFLFDIQLGGNFQNDGCGLVIGFGVLFGFMVEDSIVVCLFFMDVCLLVGVGFMLESMFLKVCMNVSVQEIWLVCVVEIGVVQVKMIKVNLVLFVGGQGFIQIVGEMILVSIVVGVIVVNVVIVLVVVINVYFNLVMKKLLFYMVIVVIDMVMIMVCNKGVWVQDVDIYVLLLVNSQNVFDGMNLMIVQIIVGFGVLSIVNIINLFGDQFFDWIICLFNDLMNIGYLKMFFFEVGGCWGWVWQIYGYVFIVKMDMIVNIIIFGQLQDIWYLMMVLCFLLGGNVEFEYEWLVVFFMCMLFWLLDGVFGNVSCNMIGFVIEGIMLLCDMVYWLDFVMCDVFFKNGILIWKVDSGGNVVIDKVIIMSCNINGVLDMIFCDIQKIGQMMYVFCKFCVQLVYEYGQKVIVDVNLIGLEVLMMIKDIEVMLVYMVKFMLGVIDKVNVVLVVCNVDNVNCVDVMMQVDMVNLFDIFVGFVKVYLQFVV